MSESIRIDAPREQLLSRARWQRITSIVSSCQPLLPETSVVKAIEHREERGVALDPTELVAHRFTTIKRLGIGGFGEVSGDMQQGDGLDRF